MSSGVPVVVNGDEYENIEIRRADEHSGVPITGPHELTDANRNLANLTMSGHMSGNLSDLERQRDSSGYGSESGDMLRELVKNKELMRANRTRKHLSKLSSADSDISEGSTLVSIASDNPNYLMCSELRRQGALIRHHTIRSVASDSETDLPPPLPPVRPLMSACCKNTTTSFLPSLLLSCDHSVLTFMSRLQFALCIQTGVLVRSRGIGLATS